MAHKTNQAASSGSYDLTLLLTTLSLVVIGLVMVFSASYYQGIVGYDNPFHFILLQIQWVVLGLVAMAAAARIPYRLWEGWSILLMGITLLLLLAVVLLGSDLFGSRRTFFGGSVQPSEAAKVVVIIYISAWLTSKGEQIKDLNYGLIPFGVLMGVVGALVVAQPDISTAILIVLTASVLFFIAGAEPRQILIIAILAGFTLWLVITQNDHAQDRITQYLASTENPLVSESWQIRNSAEAVISGGPLGAGIGAGELKTGRVPLSWSDNIFAVLSEEMGLLGSLLLVLLFALFAYRGFQIALRARDNFGALLATGITTLVLFQALLNMAVILTLAPPTGVTLPFISYGGSSMLVLLGAVGLLLSVSKYGTVARVGPGRVERRSPLGEAAYARLDLGWRDRWSRLSGSGRGRSSDRSPGRTANRPAAKQRAPSREKPQRAPRKRSGSA